MEVWLRGEGGAIQLPIVPPLITKSAGAILEEAQIVKFGKVSVYGGKEGAEFPLTSFFPGRTNSYLVKNYTDPYTYVTQIEKWRDEGTVIRLVVTGTPINVACRIKHFEYEDEIQTGDVNYTLELKEHIKTEISEVRPPGKTEWSKYPKPDKTFKKVDNNKRADTPKRSTSKNKTHTVIKNDSLYKIAAKYYGSGSLYKKIKENPENQKKYPSLKKSNTIYSNWKLVIP